MAQVERQPQNSNEIVRMQATREHKLRNRLIAGGLGTIALGAIVGLAAWPVIGISATSALWLILGGIEGIRMGLPVALSGLLHPRRKKESYA